MRKHIKLFEEYVADQMDQRGKEIADEFIEWHRKSGGTAGGIRGDLIYFVTADSGRYSDEDVHRVFSQADDMMNYIISEIDV